MTDDDAVLRELAGVRRNLENLEEEVSTAAGAMPKTTRPADEGRQNFLTVLKRLRNIEELAGETAGKLRSILQEMDS